MKRREAVRLAVSDDFTGRLAAIAQRAGRFGWALDAPRALPWGVPSPDRDAAPHLWEGDQA